MVGDVCVYGGCRGDQRCGGVCMRESVSVRVRMWVQRVGGGSMWNSGIGT